MKALRRALLGAGFAALSGCVTGNIGPACGSTPAPLPPGDSLRVLTFNTHLLSPVFHAGSVELTSGSVAQRARKIAQTLEDGFFDVIAFNEAWSEADAKDELHPLCETYPHWVKYVDADTAPTDGEDSGLMVYSKLALDPLPDSQHRNEDNESSHGTDSERVAFVEFDDCASFDCLSAKGALLVRLKHPGSGRVINFVTTHMQADEGGSHPGVRAKQLDQIRAPDEPSATPPDNDPEHLIGATVDQLPPFHLFNWPNREWILLTGDLNVQGKNAVNDAVHPGSTQRAVFSPEWWDRFGNPALAPQPTALYDAWAETTSPKDPGLTTRGGSRLDYIIASRRTTPTNPQAAAPPPDLCVQHVWIPPQLEALSDHRGVAADLNLADVQCNPRLAHTLSEQELGVVGIGEELVGIQLQRQIAHPGGIHWWRFEEPGTYLIAKQPGTDLIYEVYQESDLSSPLGGGYELGQATMLVCADRPPTATHGERCAPVQGTKIQLPAPGYVRVFDPDRAFTGPYWMAFHKFTCKSRAEACELLANATERFGFPTTGEALNPTAPQFKDSAWFKILIREQADSGLSQQLTFSVSNNISAVWNKPGIELLEASGNPVVAIDGTPVTVDETVSGTHFRARTRLNGEYFLRVDRRNLDDTIRFLARWRTDLTLLGGEPVAGHPSQLICQDETNPEYGHDEIRLEVAVDGGPFATRGFKDFDCNNQAEEWPWDDNLGVIRFLDNVRFRLVELDDGEDDVSNTESVQLAADVDLSDKPVLERSAQFAWDDGEYMLRFYLAKTPQR